MMFFFLENDQSLAKSSLTPIVEFSTNFVWRLRSKPWTYELIFFLFFSVSDILAFHWLRPWFLAAVLEYLKNEDNLKNEDSLKNEDKHKNAGNKENGDRLKNQDNTKNEEDLKEGG